MVDSDLAELYQVDTRVLIQAVKRNLKRFPADFMFQLSKIETAAMRSQFVIGSKRNVRHRPYVFTEHGALMLSSVLKSERAAKMGIYIVRVFVKLREVLAKDKDLAREFEQLRHEQRRQGTQIRQVFVILGRLLEPPAFPPKRSIGFKLR
jgi:ORF6N domain